MYTFRWKMVLGEGVMLGVTFSYIVMAIIL